jgi:hypothetical protein
MASIRKTKTEAAATDKETADAPRAAGATPKTTKTKARPAAATKARRPRVTKKKVAARRETPESGNPAYQSSGRVWPD